MPVSLFERIGRGQEAIFAKADSTPDIEVNRYTLHAVVKKNREIRMHEEITVRFLKGGFTMFYRSLPIDQGDQYFDITAECPGNAAFKYDVVTNPDSSAFLDVGVYRQRFFGRAVDVLYRLYNDHHQQ